MRAVWPLDWPRPTMKRVYYGRKRTWRTPPKDRSTIKLYEYILLSGTWYWSAHTYDTHANGSGTATTTVRHALHSEVTAMGHFLRPRLQADSISRPKSARNFSIQTLTRCAWSHVFCKPLPNIRGLDWVVVTSCSRYCYYFLPEMCSKLRRKKKQ